MKKIILKLINLFIREKKNLIHAEAIVREDEWERLKKKIGKGNIWFVLTPANYDYCTCVFNINIEKNDFIRVLKQRIAILKKNNEEIQLSIHLSKVRNFIDNNLQDEKFKEAMEFFRSLEITPTKFVLVDGVYNNYTIKLAKHYGIKELHDFNIYIIFPLLFIIKKIGIKLSFIAKFYRFLLEKKFRGIFYLILGEIFDVKEKTIHVEAIVRNDIWEILKKKLIGKGFIWYIITPANYDYCKTFFNLKMDKAEFSDVLTHRINYLKKKGEEIQLHIHLSSTKSFLDKKIQDNKFKESLNFFSSLNIKPEKYAAGWWTYNSYTVSLAKKYGIKLVSAYNINPFSKSRNEQGVIIKYVHKYWHDFEFI